MSDPLRERAREIAGPCGIKGRGSGEECALDAILPCAPCLRRNKALLAFHATVRECAETAQDVKGGFTSNIRMSEDEQEMVRDPDGPWVLNGDVAAAILRRFGLEAE